MIGAVALFGINELFNRAAFNSSFISRLFEGSPSVLIQKGKPVASALRRASISLPELRAIARRQGFDDLGEVNSAILETNGVVTMFRADEPGIYHPAEAGGLRIGKRRRAY